MVQKKRRARAKPKSKTKQKQKQRQSVVVNVSGGGGGGFIPMSAQPAPTVDYNLLASFIRQPATVAQPLRENVMSQPEISIPAFEAQPQPMSLKESIMTQTEPAFNPYTTESESERPARKPRSDIGKSRGSYKEKAVIEGRNIQNIFAMGGSAAGQSESESGGVFEVPVGMPRGSSSRFN